MKYLLLLLSLSLSVFASAAGISAVRHKKETYEVARDRHSSHVMSRSGAAEEVQQPLEKIAVNDLPDAGSYEKLEQEFFYIRDTRFIETERANFPRRLTWLYPDDGCYARAEMAKLALNQHRFAAPKKIFVFGNLFAASRNSPEGSVQWWYHVAVAYRVGSEAYVLDPALEPQRPLKLKEWNSLVGGDNTRVQYSICAAGTYDPSWNCANPRSMLPKDTEQEQEYFLPLEWSRIEELRRNPEQELGSSPPWLNSFL